MSVHSLEQLARWRILGARNSEQVLKLGVPLLRTNLGDQGAYGDSGVQWLMQRRVGSKGADCCRGIGSRADISSRGELGLRLGHWIDKS